MEQLISTTQTQNLFGGVISISTFGKPQDWRIGQIEGKRPTPRQEKIIKVITQTAQNSGADEAFSPDTSVFNRSIADQSEFKEVISVKRGGFALNRGVAAEGLLIEPHQAVWLTVADCAVIIAHHPITGRTTVVHAGRDSLHPLSTEGQRESVVHSVMHSLQKNGNQGEDSSAHEISVHVVMSIGPKNFDHNWYHPIHGAKNRKMFGYFQETLPDGLWFTGKPEEGLLNLFEIIRGQFVLCGVNPSKITRDKVDTFSDKSKSRKYLWHSNRRGDKGRNGVLVVRSE